MKPILKITNITIRIKRREKPVFQDFSMECKEGGITAVYGGAASGKTNLVESICGIRKVNKGKIDRTDKFYVIGQEFTIYRDLTVMENLDFISRIHNTECDLDKIASKTGLSKYKNTLTHKLPQSLRKMAHFACALATDFELLIVDEPSAVLDDENYEKMWELLENVKKEGKTVLVMTSRKDDLKYCDNVYDLFDIRAKRVFNAIIQEVKPEAGVIGDEELMEKDNEAAEK